MSAEIAASAEAAVSFEAEVSSDAARSDDNEVRVKLRRCNKHESWSKCEICNKFCAFADNFADINIAGTLSKTSPLFSFIS